MEQRKPSFLRHLLSGSSLLFLVLLLAWLGLCLYWTLGPQPGPGVWLLLWLGLFALAMTVVFSWFSWRSGSRKPGRGR